MNPLVVLSALFASVLAAPQIQRDGKGLLLGAHHGHLAGHAVAHPHAALVAAPPQQVDITHHTVAAPRVGVAPLKIAAPLPAPHLTSQKLPDQTVVHKPEPIITKKVHLGQTTYISGYATQILKPAIPDFKIAVPTALKGTVSHNAPIVTVEKEIHTVNQPVHVEKPYEVPYDVIKHVEKIVEVPTPVHVSVPVPVEVPHPVLGEPIVKKIVGAPVVRHHHNHVVAQPAFAHLAHAHVAHPVAAAPVAAAPVQW